MFFKGRIESFFQYSNKEYVGDEKIGIVEKFGYLIFRNQG